MTRYQRKEPEPVEFEGARVVRETAMALLVEIDGAEKWVPKSVVHDDSEVYESGDEGTLVLAGWFAEKEGLV